MSTMLERPGYEILTGESAGPFLMVKDRIARTSRVLDVQDAICLSVEPPA